MKIIRDGKEIELTDNELYTAWEEQQHRLDCDYIRERLAEYLDDLSEEEIKVIIDDRNFVSSVAYQWRKYMNNQDNGDFKWACVEDAYELVRKRI